MYVVTLKNCEVPNWRFDSEQLYKGTLVELEHTDDVLVAQCIAKTHLLESPSYYLLLEEMEKQF